MSVVIYTLVIAVTAIQAKYENEMLSLREMIEKSLLLRKSSSTTSPSDLDTIPKALLGSNSLSKTMIERWNQADLGYFDLHLNRAYEKGEIVLIGKDMYYRNIVLFVQRFQSLVTFRGATFINVNIATSLRDSTFMWYTSEFSDFNRNTLNNDSGMKNWVNTHSHHFKVPTSVTLGLLTNETYFFDNA